VLGSVLFVTNSWHFRLIRAGTTLAISLGNRHILYRSYHLSIIKTLLASLSMTIAAGLVGAQTRALTEVFHDDNFQITGVTMSKTGRLFVNYPRWSDKYVNAVVEIMKDGSVKPFPNQDWNVWDLKSQSAGQHFVCVQSVVVDDNDTL
jgi:hypothetical protein